MDESTNDVRVLHGMIRDLITHNQRLMEQQQKEVYGLMNKLSDMDDTGNVIQQGFQRLMGPLAHLRSLEPKRTLLTNDQYGQLDEVRSALAREEFTASTLPVTITMVQFIGAVPAKPFQPAYNDDNSNYGLLPPSSLRLQKGEPRS